MAYPPRDIPWPDRDQAYTYGGNSGNNDGGEMPAVPDPKSDPANDDDSVA